MSCEFDCGECYLAAEIRSQRNDGAIGTPGWKESSAMGYVDSFERLLPYCERPEEVQAACQEFKNKTPILKPAIKWPDQTPTPVQNPAQLINCMYITRKKGSVKGVNIQE